MYFQDGDFVTLFFADDVAYEDRADELVTLYRSFKTGELVGCKIKGVKRMLKTVGNFGVVITDHGSKVSLGLLFMAAAVMNNQRREEYEDLGRRYGKLTVEAPELSQAA